MPNKEPLSAEEMACLVDGRGTEAQIQEWQQRLVYHKEQREDAMFMYPWSDLEMASRMFHSPNIRELEVRRKDDSADQPDETKRSNSK